MTDGLRELLDTLTALPPRVGVSFRGQAEGATFVRPGRVTVSRTLLPTTLSLDVASGGGPVRELYAVMGLTGRDITPFSARQDVPEVVFLPGSVFWLADTVRADDWTVHLVLEVEPGRDEQGPPDLVDRFATQVAQLLADHRPRDVEAPAGKFTGDIGDVPDPT